jgi:hypothetical protein
MTDLFCKKSRSYHYKCTFKESTSRKRGNDWVGGLWEQHYSAALASLDFFWFCFFIKKKIERPAGEAKVKLK